MNVILFICGERTGMLAMTHTPKKLILRVSNEHILLFIFRYVTR